MAVPLTYVFEPLSASDRELLKRFVKRVDKLEQSAFTKEKTGLKATSIPGATHAGGPAWDLALDGADEETVKTALFDFRQVYIDTNDASAIRVINILSASAGARGTDAARTTIDELRKLKKDIKTRKKVDPYGTVLVEDESGASVERAPEEIIDAWLNGEYFHDDPDKAAELGEPGEANHTMMQFSLQMAIRDFIKLWIDLRALARAALNEPALQGDD